jgi:hypothetical protein
MKLAFVATHDMFSRRQKGLNCTFYKWRHGPLSNEVYHSWDMLKQSGFLREDEVIYLTSDGDGLAEELWRDVLCSKQNEVFAATITDVAKNMGALTTSTILSRVYDMKVTPIGYSHPMAIRDVPLTTHLTEALTTTEAREAIQFDQGWLETLRIALNPESAQSLACAVAQFARDEVIAP